jgi:ribokinase
MTSRGPLVVLGAINVDLVVSGKPLPTPGQTVVGGVFHQHHGGKGGNQAVAAARVLPGERVVMLGAAGDDPMGATARDALAAEGVDVSRVRTVEGAATGVALIAVDELGENQISVAPGANAAVDDIAGDLDAERPELVLASCEVAFAALRSAADWCKRNAVPFMLNPAPASDALRGLLDAASVITPNRIEVAELERGVTDPLDAARSIVARHRSLTVVVTLGADGATIVGGADVRRVEAPMVAAVDATGAGDCFNGVLAAALFEGRPTEESVRRACVAAALSTRVTGAREGMPTASELAAALV